MSERNYSAHVVSATTDLTGRQMVVLRNFSDMAQLNDLTKEEDVLINIDYVACVEVHNEKSDNKDYMKYIFVDRDGTKYITGSEPLYREYTDIKEALEAAGDTDPISIKVMRKQSKNNQNDFLTCILV